MKKKIFTFMNSTRYEIIILIPVFVACIATVLQSVTALEEQYGLFFDILDILLVIIFGLDYILSIYTAEDKLKYIFSVNGIIDLLSVVPALIPASTIDLKFLQVIRILRVVRVFKLDKYSEPLDIIKRVFIREKEILITTVSLAAIVVFITSVIVYSSENIVQPDKFPDIMTTMWWAISTVTTVGYGDMYPITVVGRIAGSLLVILGIGLIAIPSGVLSAGFISEMRDRGMFKEK